MAKMTKVWLRTARFAWRNDGGEIPHRLRGRCRRHGNSTVVIANPLQKVRKGHWIVDAGGQLFGFDRAAMDHLYSRVPV
jgi:hypothetical protein